MTITVIVVAVITICIAINIIVIIVVIRIVLIANYAIVEMMHMRRGGNHACRDRSQNGLKTSKLSDFTTTVKQRHSSVHLHQNTTERSAIDCGGVLQTQNYLRWAVKATLNVVMNSTISVTGWAKIDETDTTSIFVFKQNVFRLNVTMYNWVWLVYLKLKQCMN